MVALTWLQRAEQRTQGVLRDIQSTAEDTPPLKKTREPPAKPKRKVIPPNVDDLDVIDSGTLMKRAEDAEGLAILSYPFTTQC